MELLFSVAANHLVGFAAMRNFILKYCSIAVYPYLSQSYHGQISGIFAAEQESGPGSLAAQN